MGTMTIDSIGVVGEREGSQSQLTRGKGGGQWGLLWKGGITGARVQSEEPIRCSASSGSRDR